ncbi:F-box and leucine-rich repeat protein 4 [Sorochytrium milnesiophthora]
MSPGSRISRAACLTQLPEEIIVYILRLLQDEDDLMTAASSSRKLQRLAYDKGVGSQDNGSVTRLGDIHVAARFDRGIGDMVVSLELVNSDIITDASLEIVSWRCPNLRKLNVSGCARVTDAGLMRVYYACELETLTLWCSNVSGYSWGPPKVFAVDNRATDRLMYTMARDASRAQRIRELSVGRTRVTDAALLYFIRAAPNLRRINLNDCQTLANLDNVFSCLSQWCPSLEKIYAYVPGDNHLGPEGIHSIGNIKSLKRLATYSDDIHVHIAVECLTKKGLFKGKDVFVDSILLDAMDGLFFTAEE